MIQTSIADGVGRQPPELTPAAAARTTRASVLLATLNHPFVVLILSLAMPLLASRGAITFGSVSYDYLRDTRAMVEGGGFGALTPYEPVGYDLLLAPWVLAGFDPIAAAAALSLVAFVCTVFFIRSILGAELNDKRIVALGVLAVVFHEKLVTYATQIWAEGIYAAASLGAIWAFGRLYQKGYLPDRRRDAVTYAFLIAAPAYFSYSGIVVTASVSAALLYGAATRRRAAEASAAAGHGLVALLAALIALLVLLTVARNYSLLGTLSGYPQIESGYSLGEAMRGMIRQTGVDAVGIPFRVAERIANAAPNVFVALTGVGLASLLLLAPRRPVPLLIAVNIAAYVGWFAYFESSSRLDVIGTRIVYPLAPLITTLLVLVAASARGFTPRLSAVAGYTAWALLAVCVSAGVYKIGRGWRGDHQERIFGYSPETLNATLHLVRNAPAVGIGVNRYGSQILAYSSRLNVVLVPYVDHLNGSYQESFGIKTWSEQEARAEFRKQRVEWIVFFEGPTRTDPYAAAGSYGEFVSRIRRGPIAGERERFETADGLLIRMDPSAW